MRNRVCVDSPAIRLVRDPALDGEPSHLGNQEKVVTDAMAQGKVLPRVESMNPYPFSLWTLAGTEVRGRPGTLNLNIGEAPASLFFVSGMVKDTGLPFGEATAVPRKPLASRLDPIPFPESSRSCLAATPDRP